MNIFEALFGSDEARKRQAITIANDLTGVVSKQAIAEVAAAIPSITEDQAIQLADKFVAVVTARVVESVASQLQGISVPSISITGTIGGIPMELSVKVVK